MHSKFASPFHRPSRPSRPTKSERSALLFFLEWGKKQAQEICVSLHELNSLLDLELETGEPKEKETGTASAWRLDPELFHAHIEVKCPNCCNTY